MGGQEEAKRGEGWSARWNWKHMRWSDCWFPPTPPSRQPHTTKPGDGPEMVLGLTAKVMIHGQCFVADWQYFMKERWQLANAKQMQMTQCIVYYTGVFKYDLYINCERPSDQTKQIIIVWRRIAVAQISGEPGVM